MSFIMLKMDINLTLTLLSYISCTCICIMKYFNYLLHIKDVSIEKHGWILLLYYYCYIMIVIIIEILNCFILNFKNIILRYYFS